MSIHHQEAFSEATNSNIDQIILQMLYDNTPRARRQGLSDVSVSVLWDIKEKLGISLEELYDSLYRLYETGKLKMNIS